MSLSSQNQHCAVPCPRNLASPWVAPFSWCARGAAGARQLAVLLSLLVASVCSVAAEVGADAPPVAQGPVVDSTLAEVEQSLLELEQDLAILEEDLLYPPSSRVAVFLALDVGELIALDAVQIKLNGRDVATHLYTDRQLDALRRGGVQQVFVGNAKQGRNEIAAFLSGTDEHGRTMQQATSVEFEKGFEPAYVELLVADSERLQRPTFSARVY